MSQPSVLPLERGKSPTPGIIPLSKNEDVVSAKTVTPSGMGDSLGSKVVKKMRSFEEIIAEEKENRNILEIKITRKEIEEDGVMKPAKALSMDDVSVLIFDMIAVNPQDCLGVALYTSRFDTKEVKLKPGVDASLYLTKDSPINFKNHEIVVTSQTANLTKVTFKNVAFNIPDEEILNLCSCYGELVDSVVSYEKPTLNSRGVMGATRYVDIKLTPGKQLENFYWLEGPLEGDRGCRITVLHTGQEKQCSHCLRREADCPGAGVGKVCYKMGTSRGQMGDYMKHLYIHHNYMSMKMKFNQIQFPQLGSKGQASDGFGHIVESEKNVDEIEIAVEPVQRNDANERIAELEAELSEAKSKLERAGRPRVVRYAFDVPLEIFDYDEEKDEVTVKDETEFETFVDKKCKAEIDRDKKKIDLRNKLLDQVRQIERRKRSLSISSITSLDSPSRRRDRSTDSIDGEGADAKQSRLAQHLSAQS